MFASKPVRVGIAIAMSGLLALMPLISTAQQVSVFSIAGWTQGAVPLFNGSTSNVIHLNYGDSLSTGITFTGSADDGLGTDQNNMAYMDFTYSYTIYLTPSGTAFSSASIPVGTHTVIATQSCSSGMVPPWTIGCDTQVMVSGDSVVMNVSDGISDCVNPGDYQVDIVLDNYSIGTGGPNPSQIALEWMSGNLAPLSIPESANSALTALTPIGSYILSQVAFVHVAAPAECPALSVSMQQAATGADVSSATVIASYPGHCVQNPCSYQWSDGQTGATAVELTTGIYTVTVTAPCGTTATASVTITHHAPVPSANGEVMVETLHAIPHILNAGESVPSGHMIHGANGKDKKSDGSDNTATTLPEVINAYPNPASHTVYFDLKDQVDGPYMISITDLAGREVKKIAYDITTTSVGVDLDDLPAGIYIYQISAGRTYSGKFVKQ